MLGVAFAPHAESGACGDHSGLLGRRGRRVDSPRRCDQRSGRGALRDAAGTAGLPEQSADQGRCARDPLRASNAGKSSLLNLLVDSDVAIVSSVPGTTRDVLRAEVDLRGFKVVLQDTAGLRAASDELEREGMSRARAAAEESPLRMVVVEAGKDPVGDVDRVMAEVRGEGDTMVVINKSDLVSEQTIAETETRIRSRYPHVRGTIWLLCSRRCDLDLVHAEAEDR